jgi:hypothetical protein
MNKKLTRGINTRGQCISKDIIEMIPMELNFNPCTLQGGIVEFASPD